MLARLVPLLLGGLGCVAVAAAPAEAQAPAAGAWTVLGGSVQFNAPTGVAVDAAGDVYVADQGNNVVDSGNNRIQELSTNAQ